MALRVLNKRYPDRKYELGEITEKCTIFEYGSAYCHYNFTACSPTSDDLFCFAEVDANLENENDVYRCCTIGSGPDGLSMLLYLLPSSLFILKIYYCLLHLCFGLLSLCCFWLPILHITESICLIIMQILSATRFLLCTMFPLSVFTYRTCIVVWAQRPMSSQTDQIITFTSVCALAGAVNMAPFLSAYSAWQSSTDTCMGRAWL